MKQTSIRDILKTFINAIFALLNLKSLSKPARTFQSNLRRQYQIHALPIVVNMIGLMVIWLVIPAADAMSNRSIQVMGDGTRCPDITFTLPVVMTPENTDNTGRPAYDCGAILVKAAAEAAIDATATATSTPTFTPGPPSAVDISLRPITAGSDTAIGVTSNGLSYIAYQDAATHLQLIRCLTTDCSQNVESTIDSASQTAYEISMEMNSQDLPVMTYYEFNLSRVRVAFCVDVSCTPSVYLFPGNYTTNGAIALELDSNDVPYIAYRTYFGDFIRIVRCNSATTCDTQSFIGAIASSGSAFDFRLDSNNIPIIVDSLTTRLIRCNSSISCSSPTISNFGAITGSINQPSLALNSNNIPWILFRGGFDARLALCESATSCVNPSIFVLAPEVGGYGSTLALDNDVPVVGFRIDPSDGTNDYVTIARCESTTTCNTPSFLPYDTNRQFGDHISLVMHSGIPYLSYINDALHFYRGPNNTPALINNMPLTIDQQQTAVIDRATLLTTDADTFQTLTYRVVSPPTQGTLNLGGTFTQEQIDANALTYTHTSGGSDSFTFTVSDGVTTIGNYTFNINVNVAASPTATLTLTPTATTAPLSAAISENEFFTAFEQERSAYPVIAQGVPDFVPNGINLTVSLNTGEVGQVSVTVTNQNGFVTLQIASITTLGGGTVSQSYLTAINNSLIPLITATLDNLLLARFGSVQNVESITIDNNSMILTLIGS